MLPISKVRITELVWPLSSATDRKIDAERGDLPKVTEIANRRASNHSNPQLRKCFGALFT